MASSSTNNAKDGVKRHIIPDVNQEILILDPNKSQNIAILLRALNLTIEEVCEALKEGEDVYIMCVLYQSINISTCLGFSGTYATDLCLTTHQCQI